MSSPGPQMKTCSLWPFVVASFITKYLLAVQGIEFVTSPQSVNATLNSTVTFTCQVTGEFISLIWKINNTRTQSTSFDNGEVAELEVFCSEDRDMSVVECGVILPNPNHTIPMLVYSDPASLQVQGLLGPVTNLSVLSTTTSITLTWVPPFSLDITRVEPDFTHTVEVYNICITSDGGRQEVGVYENITDSTFTFNFTNECESQSSGSSGDGMNESSGDGVSMMKQTYESNSHCNPDPSDLFQFIVTAVNAVGRGESSDRVNMSFKGPSTTESPKPSATNPTTPIPEMTSTHPSVTSPLVPTSVNPTTESSSTNSDESNNLIVSSVVVAMIVVVASIAVVLIVIAGILCIVVRKQRLKTIKVHGHASTQISCYEEIPPHHPHVFNGSTHHNNTTPIVNQSSLNGNAAKDEGISMYVTAQDLDLKPGGQHPVPSDTNVVYSEVPKHLNPKNLIYEHVDVKPASKTRPVDDQSTVVYSDIKTVAEQANDIHVTQQQPCSGQTLSKVESPPSTPLPQPFTHENLLSALSPVTHKWRELGLQLEHGIDEDRIDEFDTNNETDDGCLEEMMDYYFTNVHFEHTWEEICGALRDIGEEGLAGKIASS